MEYEIVERDFVVRSLLLLEQYDKHVKPSTLPEKHFEVTLLLNCLLGLIILPFEHLKRKQNNQFPKICEGDETPIHTLDNEWGLNKLEISKIVMKNKILSQDDITLRVIFAMFRHSMSHSRFEDGNKHPTPDGLSVAYEGTKNNPLESVISKVNLNNKYKNTEFRASIPVESLRKFTTKLATTFLNENFNENN